MAKYFLSLSRVIQEACVIMLQGVPTVRSSGHGFSRRIAPDLPDLSAALRCRLAQAAGAPGYLTSTLYIFSQVQVQKTASFAMNSRASSSGRMTPPMSPMSSHLRLCDQ